MSDFRPLSDLARFVLDLIPGQTVIPAEHLEAAAELVTGRPVVAADFDLDDHIDTLAAEFGRELDFRLDDVVNEWSAL